MLVFVIFVFTMVGIILGLVFHKPMLQFVAEDKAKPVIDKMLFSEKGEAKRRVLLKIRNITNNRLSDDLLLDYYYKTKGQKQVKISKLSNLWLKVYLLTPPKIKLNYYEQLNFYNAFLQS